MSAPRLSYICASCRRAASSSGVTTSTKRTTRTAPSLSSQAYSTSAVSTLPQAPPPSGHTKLTHRRLLLLHGPDTPHYLNGITTASVRHSLTSGFYSCFLNAQGRILHDVFIYPAPHSKEYISRLPNTGGSKWKPEDPAFFIECDATQTADLLKHLKRYKLRAKFEMRVIDEGEWDVHAYWDGEERWTAHQTSSPAPNASPEIPQHIGATDSRAPGMGHRIVLPNSSSLPPQLNETPPTALPAYHLRRLLRGVPENQSLHLLQDIDTTTEPTHEIPYATSLPHEHNTDLMSGIDFKKGCYVGQELTIRTQHTGVVRKRCLPVMLYPSSSSTPETLSYEPETTVRAEGYSGANILPLDTNAASKARPRPAGKLLCSVGNVGLGLCRVEKMTDVVLTGEGSGWGAGDEFYLPEDEGGGGGVEKREGGLRVKAFVPDWIRNQIKVREPQRRVD